MSTEYALIIDLILIIDVSTLSDVSRQCQQVLEDMYTQAVQKQHLWSQNLVILHLESSYDAIKHQVCIINIDHCCHSRRGLRYCFILYVIRANIAPAALAALNQIMSL